MFILEFLNNNDNIGEVFLSSDFVNPLRVDSYFFNKTITSDKFDLICYKDLFNNISLLNFVLSHISGTNKFSLYVVFWEYNYHV